MTAEDLIREAAIQVPERDLREIVRRIVDATHPDKIILFGSAARGAMRPNSDLDLLVIKAGDYHHRALTVDVLRALSGIEYPTDVVVATPQEVERYKDSYCLVIHPAIREGKVIYEKTAVRSG
jgi:predicted nucleotidyltransferase